MKNCSLWRHLPRWLIGGLLYGLLEIIHHGHTHWTMILLAVLLCITLDLTNEALPWHLPLALQGLIGGEVKKIRCSPESMACPIPKRRSLRSTFT